MNRIILIGNGFDLAHGLPTRYKDFIDDFWKREVEKIREANFLHLRDIEIQNFLEFERILKIRQYIEEDKRYLYSLKEDAQPYVVAEEDELEYEVALEYSTTIFQIKELQEKVKRKNLNSIEKEAFELTKEFLTAEVRLDNSDLRRIKSILEEILKDTSEEDEIKKWDSLEREIIEKKISGRLPANQDNSISPFSFNNKFFEYITRHVSLKNWVDIESEYHRFLVAISRNENVNTKDKPYVYTSVKELNRDFAQIKKELEEYLKRIQESHQVKPIEEIKEIIHSRFDIMDFTSKGLDGLAKHVESKLDRDFSGKVDFQKYPGLLTFEEGGIMKKLKEKLVIPTFSRSYNLKPQELLFLNFNYTNLEELYLDEKKEINQEIIHIHGELDAPGNPIIFGYGDEIGEEYAQLEKLNDNNYLENIKSIRYLEADSYKRLLTFVDSGEYQIFIFGHSCGNSDRTLLNTLFEHDNCVSVKFYYWQKDENEDDFSDIIRNISRNFNDKVSMREKVVNKNYSQPLRELK